MRKRILALVLALTVSLCPVMTADAAMIVKNNMGALYTSNILVIYWIKTRQKYLKIHCRKLLWDTRSTIQQKIWKL